MVGTDGYAPSTPRMSIEYSTIELSSPLIHDYPIVIQNSKLLFFKPFLTMSMNSRPKSWNINIESKVLKIYLSR